MNTTFRKTPTNKIERALLIARYWRLLSPIPDGCQVTIAKCDCPPQHCECEIELELDGSPAAWAANADFEDRMHEFLMSVDPASYAARPIDPRPITVISMERRLEAMAARVAAGFVAKNIRDIDVSLMKVGEDAGRGRNGSAFSLGLEEFQDVEADEPLRQGRGRA